MTKKTRALGGALAGVLFGLLLASPPMRPGPRAEAQDQPSQEQQPQAVREPSYDYMSTFLSRGTHPLGFKEDPAVRRMLGQGSVAWAIRAGSRHVLD